MRYGSTRSNIGRADALRAVLTGMAPDGGLYMPEDAAYSEFDWKSLMGKPFQEIAERVLGFFLDDFGDLRETVDAAYTGRFGSADVTPLREVGDRYVLELFHGPTSAFKDVALSILPYLMVKAARALGETRRIMILTATSGDTGKAALQGFSDVPGTGITVFYPYGGVSRVQELQMTTQQGGNVRSAAVRGNFDDVQRTVKEIFEQTAKGDYAGADRVVFSSANSINIGRLVPQIVYYFKAYSDLVGLGKILPGDPVDFTVPTGNFGDILAGLFAKMLGLPVGKLVCASNANDVLFDFINTGVYDRRRPFLKTDSPSMDILVASNLERLIYLLADGDKAFTAEKMRALSEQGVYEIPEPMREKLAKTFAAGRATDEATEETIGRVFREYGYLLDPHTAVGWSAADGYLRENGNARPMVVLATASPFKFSGAVRRSIGLPELPDEFAGMRDLSEKTGVPVPEGLAALKSLPVRFTDVIGREEMYGYIMEHLK